MSAYLCFVCDGTNGFALLVFLLAAWAKNTSPPKRGGKTEALVRSVVFVRSVRHRTPARRQLLGAAQRDCKDRIGWVRGTLGREDARTRDPQIGNFVGLAMAVDHRVCRTRAHDGSTVKVGGGYGVADPGLLGSSRLYGALALLEFGSPERDRIVIEAVHQAGERHAVGVLVADELDAVFPIRQSLAEQRHAGEAAGRLLHELVQL